MAKENNEVLLNLEISGDSKKLKALLGQISDGLSTAISASLTKSVSTFATKLGQSVQISFNDTILSSLNKPIKVGLDLKDAKKDIADLIAPLQLVLGKLPQIKDESNKQKEKEKKEKAAPKEKELTDKQKETAANKKLKDAEVAQKNDKTAAAKLGIVQNANQLTDKLNNDPDLSRKFKGALTELLNLSKEIQDVNPNEKGIFSRESLSQLSKFETTLKNINKAVLNYEEFQATLDKFREIAKSPTKPIDSLDKQLAILKKDLAEQEGLAEKGINKITDPISKDIDFIRKKYNLLFDELAKGKEGADQGIVLSAKRAVETRTAQAESSFKSVADNRDLIKNRAVDITLEELIAEEQRIADLNFEKFLAHQKADIAEQAKIEEAALISKNARLLEDRKITAKEIAQRFKDQEALAAANFAIAQKQRDLQKKVSTSQTKLTPQYLDQFNKQLTDQRNLIASGGAPLEFVTRQTTKYDTALEKAATDLDLVNVELKNGNITLDAAAKKYDRIDSYLRRVGISISKIDSGKINTAFTNSGSTQKITDAEAKATVNRLSPIINQDYINKVNDELTQQRLNVAKLGVPLNVVNKQTQNYDTTLITARRNLEDLTREFKAGNITTAEAAKQYVKLEGELRKLEIGIEQIDPIRLKKAFDLEEADPRKLAFNLGILSFSLGTLGNTLTNFSRNFFQTFDQLSQAGEPIERVINQLDLQVKQGVITLDQQSEVLSRLREIGDLPGSSVEKANETYNALQRINISLEKRLDLTEGLAKLASAPGGDENSASRFSEAISKIALKNGVEGDNFKTLRETGGKFIENFFSTRGIGTAGDLEKFGITNFIKELADSLKDLQVPAATTEDRMNKLKSRMSELGVVFGKVIGPGLDQLNLLLRNAIIPAIEKLVAAFDKLPESSKIFISELVVGIPLAIGALGGLLTILSTIGLAFSGFKQLEKVGPLLKTALGITGDFKGIKDIFSGLNFSSAFKGIETIEGAAKEAKFTVVELFKTISATGENYAKTFFAPIRTIIENFITFIKSSTSGLVDTIKVIIAPLSESITSIFSVTKVIDSTFRVPASVGVFTRAIEFLIATILKIPVILLGTPFLTSFNYLKGIGGILKSLFTSLPSLLRGGLKGITALFSTITGGISSIGGGIAKILGFTNPIGIAINLILSVFTALFTNFNGIRDRIVTTFGTLDTAVRKLLATMGIDGGLLYVLGKIGDAFNFIFGIIGETVLDVFVALGNNLASIVDNLTNIINAFKQGDYLTAFGESILLILNTVLGFAKNLVIELLATLGDGIAALIRKIPVLGGGAADEINDVTNDFRKFSGTDKASLLTAQLRRERLSELDKVKKKEEEIAQVQKNAEIERKKRLQGYINDLNDLTNKTKDDFNKFKGEELVNTLNAIQDTIKESNSINVNNFKEFIEATSDLDLVTQRYNSTISDLQKNQERLIATQNTANFTKTISEFRELTSSRGDLKALFDSVKDGQTEFKGLVDAIYEANGATSSPQLQSALAQLQSVAQSTKVQGLNSDFSVVIENIVAKTKSNISQNTRETQKLLKDYRSTISDLEKVERQRLLNIRNEKLNYEFERSQRLREYQNRVTDAQNERTNLQRENNEGLTGTTNINQQQAEIAKRYSDQKAEIDRLKLDLIRKQNEIIIKVGNTLPDNYDVANDTEILNLKKQIDDLEKANKDLNIEQSKTYDVKRVITFSKTIQSLGDVLRSISEISSDISDSITKAFGFSNASSDKNVIVDNLNFLKQLTQQLPRNSAFTQQYTKIVDQLTSGQISFGDATERAIRLLSEFQNLDAKKQSESSLTTLRKGNFDFNQNSILSKKIGGGLKSEDFSGVGDLVYRSLINNEKLLGKLNKGIDPVTGNPQFEAVGKLTPEQQERLTNILAQRDKSKNEIGDEITQLLVEISKGDSLFFEETLKSLFEFSDVNEQESTNLIELIAKGLQYVENRRKEIEANTKSTIENRVKIVDGVLNSELSKIDNGILSKETKIKDLEDAIGSAIGSERKKLTTQLNYNKLQLVLFNYQRLDVEEAYNTQKAIIQANGNKDEIKRIVKNSELKRAELIKQRDLDIKALGEEGGLNLKNGEILDPDGKPVVITQPTTVKPVGTDTASAVLTNGTSPAKGIPALSKSEQIINDVTSLTDALNGVGNKAQEAGDKLLEMWNKMASGEGVINIFKRLLGGAEFKLKDLGEAFKNVAEFAITAFGDALGKAITDTILNGGNFLKNLKKFFGDTLIAMGQQLVSLGAMATAIGLLALIPFFSYLDPDHRALIIGPIAIAAGIGAILAGKALGGGSQGAAASNTGTTNSANSSAGNSGQVDYDPEKDPKLIYQKALRTQVYIDIKRDDGSIVKAIVKQTNRNPQFANIISNERSGFAL